MSAAHLDSPSGNTEKFRMYSQNPLVDDRKAAFARLASRVIETLNGAVTKRKDEGHSMVSIADRIGYNRSALSRTLNGTTRNITLRTISDILWATNFDPKDFSADPIEEISPNWVPIEQGDNSTISFNTYSTKEIRIDTSIDIEYVSGSLLKRPTFEHSSR